jgi:UDP-glucose 4-epimerase
MDLVHVADIARANLLAATMPATDVALNIGSGTETSLLELAEHVVAAMGRGGLAPIHEPERRVNPVPRRLSDTSSARELLGFVAERPLRDGIKDLVAWWSDLKRREAAESGRAA